MKKLFLFIFMMLVSLTCFAQEVALEEPINQLVDLIKNWKAMSPIAISIAIVMILTNLLKTKLLVSVFEKGANPLVKRLVITILGQVAGILTMIATGMPWLNAVIVGLISSGGAVAIYEAWKGLKKK